jgi:hypothetical protein
VSARDKFILHSAKALGKGTSPDLFDAPVSAKNMRIGFSRPRDIVQQFFVERREEVWSLIKIPKGQPTSQFQKKIAHLTNILMQVAVVNRVKKG